MRVFGKIAWGVAALAAIYFCADLLITNSRRLPEKRLVVAKEREVPQAARKAPFVERAPAPLHAAQVTARDEPPAEHPQPDRSTELATTLEAQYAVDARPTRESVDRESAIKGLFSQPELDGKGRLEEVDCRETVCRGVVKIDSDQAEIEVFGQTFLSPKFAAGISDAVTIASRQKMSDGSVLATFFVYPQSVLEMVNP